MRPAFFAVGFALLPLRSPAALVFEAALEGESLRKVSYGKILFSLHIADLVYAEKVIDR